MKRLIIKLAFLLGLLSTVPAFAQTSTQQSATELTAGTICSSLDAASGSATLTPPSGSSVYLTYIDINIGATGTLTAANPIKATSSGLVGSPTFGLFNQTALTQGGVGSPFTAYPRGAVKGQQSTAVSITGASFTNGVWHITVCGYFAP